jgi:hypothetical protein
MTTSRRPSSDRGAYLAYDFDFDRSTINVWDALYAKCLTTLHVDGPFYTCSIHGEGELMVAGGASGTLLLRLRFPIPFGCEHAYQ